MRSIRTWALGLVILFLPGAGAWLLLRGRTSEDPARLAQALRGEAERVWKLKCSADWLKVWEAYEQDYRDKAIQAKWASGQLDAIKFYGFQIKDVSVTGDTGIVTVEADRSFPELDKKLTRATKVYNDIRTTRRTETFSEAWVLAGGKWFLRSPEERAVAAGAPAPSPESLPASADQPK